MMIDRLVRDNLLAIVDAYRRATGKSLTACSKEFYGNATFFADLRSGRVSVSVKKLSEMVEAFREQWPAGTRWPVTRVIVMGRQSAA